MKKLLWTPAEEFINSTIISHFTKWLSDKTGNHFKNYKELHSWSVNNIEKFWELFFEYSEIIYSGKAEYILDTHKMPGAKWFGGIKLNYAENILEKKFSGTAIKYLNENNNSDLSKNYKSEYSFEELKKEVSKCAFALKQKGIKKGDRVAGYISNVPEAVIACLACASIGAVWSSTSPDFGLNAVADRFSQINPKIVFASSNYFYNGKIHSAENVLSSLKEKIHSIEEIVVVPFAGEKNNSNNTFLHWEEFLNKEDKYEIEYAKLNFDNELFIMFSSGTTGIPKCIVHGVGGTLLQHKKEHMLHCDIKPGDKLFYFTTTGWMMWNWQLSALACGATIYLYEGSPAYPKLYSIWDIVNEEKITHFGTSGRYIEACMKSEDFKIFKNSFEILRSVFYTGSPLSEKGYEWIYNNLKNDLHLAGISGGTDIISCFVLGNPTLPVYAGKIQCKGLAVDAAAFDEKGDEIINAPGELVCRKPIPSMPLKFLNDLNNEKYLKSYFNDYKNVWTHGDYIEFDENGSSIIYGRSDATLNPGGVRIGCAEIYSALDDLKYIKGALAVGWTPPNQSDEIIILFVMMDDSLELDEKIESEIKKAILKKNSPKHIPKYIFRISGIPITRSGKPVELTLKAVLAGKEVSNKTALENPEILEEVKLYRKKLSAIYA